MLLETERLHIRDFTESDVADVYAYGSDPEVVRFMPFPPSTPESTRAHIARCIRLANEQPRRWYDLAVVRKADGHLIGGIALDVFDRSAGHACFAYLFNRTAWGHGYATEALKRMVRFGFDVLTLSQLTDSCDSENVASARVMEKCGFWCEGERDGERLYTLTADAWQQMQKAEVPNQA